VVTKICREFSSLVKIGQNFPTFTHRHTCIVRTFVTILFAKLTMTVFVMKVNSVYLVAIGARTEFFIGMGMTSGYI